MEKEQERRWQREVMGKLNELAKKQEELAARQDQLATLVMTLAS